MSVEVGAGLRSASESAAWPTIESAATDHFSITRIDKLQALASTLDENGFPPQLSLMVDKQTDLRYGENPHQKAALYKVGEDIGLTQSELLSGKEMSFNNYVDAD